MAVIYTKNNEWSGDIWLDPDPPDFPHNDDSDDPREENNVKVVASMRKVEQTPGVPHQTTVRSFTFVELTDLQTKFSSKPAETPLEWMTHKRGEGANYVTLIMDEAQGLLLGPGILLK